MLNVLTLKEAENLLNEKFAAHKTLPETIESKSALGRAFYEDIKADEFVPGFTRSTVDGFAVKASDTYGSSAAIPAMLEYKGEILMGKEAAHHLSGGDCYKISTGGMLPAGADAAIMVEHTEDMGDSFVYTVKAVAPGENLVQKGDDVKAGDLYLRRGSQIGPKEIGALAATGKEKIQVFKKPKVAILSTGDELVSPEEKPEIGQVRDVNSRLLTAAVEQAGGQALTFDIVCDEYAAIKRAIKEALEGSDMVLISGGSSAGEKDMTVDIIGQLGQVFMHGLALKPGKPTIIGAVGGKPVIGLPGHPVAAFFVFKELLKPLIGLMTDTKVKKAGRRANLSTNYPSNHGREEIVPVRLLDENDKAEPLFIKSGLLTLLGKADGYIKIPRDSEGLKKGQEVEIYLF
ncbi:MAG: molybdopterin molybdenumtransferase MoeA [Clostridiales bacterium]|nr:molybdopterin molybdenumtransferase MoeA [Clostridiales bacterium]